MTTMLICWRTRWFWPSIKDHDADGVARWVLSTTLGIYLVLLSMPPVQASSLVLDATKVSAGQAGLWFTPA